MYTDLGWPRLVTHPKRDLVRRASHDFLKELPQLEYTVLNSKRDSPDPSR